MARVTVEDCIEIVPNRFDLVLLAARRAREIASGAAVTVPRDNDKNPVVALREIAERTVDTGVLKESIIKSMQRVGFREDTDVEGDEASTYDTFSSNFVQAYEDVAVVAKVEDDEVFEDDEDASEDDSELEEDTDNVGEADTAETKE